MEKVGKDIKLNIAKDITTAYISSYNKDNEKKLNIDEVCETLKKVYLAVEEIVPEKGDRKIGLGI